MCNVVEEIPALGVFDVDVVREIVDQVAQQVALAFELFLDFLDDGDVPVNTVGTRNGPSKMKRPLLPTRINDAGSPSPRPAAV